VANQSIELAYNYLNLSRFTKRLANPARSTGQALFGFRKPHRASSVIRCLGLAVTIPFAKRRVESIGRPRSVPRPAFGGAMLTLLRACRSARLWAPPDRSSARSGRCDAASLQPEFFGLARMARRFLFT
jgi:hypothetical protein